MELCRDGVQVHHVPLLCHGMAASFLGNFKLNSSKFFTTSLELEVERYLLQIRTELSNFFWIAYLFHIKQVCLDALLPHGSYVQISNTRFECVY